MIRGSPGTVNSRLLWLSGKLSHNSPDFIAIRKDLVDLASQLQNLYQQFGELPGITIELHQSLIAVGVRNDAAVATVFLQGAQLSHYQRHGEEPLIWCSPLCDFQPGQSLRGGIPICWPWFGDLNKNPVNIRQQIDVTDAPAHGFVRNLDWQLDDIEQVSNSLTRLRLSFDIPDRNNKLWPFMTQLQLTIEIGGELSLQFSVKNCDVQDIYFSSALHSYLAVGDIHTVSVDGLDGKDYIDALDDWQLKPQHGAVTIDREVDRIYNGVGSDTTVIDPQSERQIRLTSLGSTSTVVWNPWQEKAKRLSCFDPGAYRQMLCIETGNIGADSIALAPNACHQLGVRIY